MDLSNTLAAWWKHVVSSPPGSTFAILARDPRRAVDEVVRPFADVTPDYAKHRVRISLGGPCIVFDQRIHIITHEHKIRGLVLHGFYVHDSPFGTKIARSRLAPGGQYYYHRVGG